MRKLVITAALLLAALLPGARAERIYAVTTSYSDGSLSLFGFDTTAPNTHLSTTGISGLQSGETILGIDLRPATVTVYALTNQSRLYTLNLLTGAATVVGTQFSTALNGTNFGFDFNPVTDRVRITSNTGQNLVINPNTAAVESSGAVFDGAPYTALAYANNINGASTTQLYGIASDNSLRLIDETTNGSTVIGSISGSNYIPSVLGFDISGSGVGYYNKVNSGVMLLQSVNLANGSSTNLGIFDTGNAYLVGMTVVPEPGTAGLLALAGLALVLRPRRRR
jgi:hypothetical protein